MSKYLQSIPVTTRGILALMLALTCLSSMDATVKYLGDSYEVFQLIWIRFLGQSILVLFIVFAFYKKSLKTTSFGMQMLRSFFLFIGTVCFFVGVTTIELGAATAILQVNPIFIALGGYFLLGEQLGWEKIVGVSLGLLGTLIIIRPGSDVFTFWTLFPIAAAMGFAGYAIVTRYLSRSESVWNSLLYTTVIGAILSSFIVPFFWSPIAIGDLPFLLLIIVMGTLGQLFIIIALFWAPTTTLAPISYFSIIVATFFGMVFFNEFPDLFTYFGALVIMVSGLFVWWIQRQRVELSLN
ncbi:MAG: DMT family transporter [Rhodobacteraceae bacterium]|nr:DMT family transporter [Paracoccaceae bacterium]